MTTMELRTAFLQEVVAIMDDGEETVQKALDNLRRLRRKAEAEAGATSKEEILSGIAEGLREMKTRHQNKAKGQTLQELIDEL